MVNSNRQIEKNKLIAVTGPTASGKTRFAALLAAEIGAEIISADSRQVYRGMDLGTGKDYEDYIVNGQAIPAHLIDIADPGQPYNVYAFQQDFLAVYEKLTAKNKSALVCGGSGLYIEAVLKGYRLIEVPPDQNFRDQAAHRTTEELVKELTALQPLHNTTDTENRKRLIRALEIARHYKKHPHKGEAFPSFEARIIGLRYDRKTERKRITERLTARLQTGMIEEVKRLTEQYGAEKMEYFGLEYKFISLYLKGELSYDDMFSKLNTAIHQFAKRQMTWFRRMEKNGLDIFWIPGELPMPEKLHRAINYLQD